MQQRENPAIFYYVSHALNWVFNLRSLLPLNLAHAKQDEENNSLFQQNPENSCPILNFKSTLLEGSFPLLQHCITVSSIFKIGSLLSVQWFFFSISLTHSALKYLFLKFYLSKPRLNSSFYLGPLAFSFTHPSALATQCEHQPRKTNKPTSSSLARISLFGSSRHFLHLKILILRII